MGRLREYHPGDRVIFERSPVDYVAYLLALHDLERETADAELTRRSIAVARSGVGLLDVIVYARVRSGGGPESEDPMLRRAVAGRLDDLLLDDDLDLFGGSQPRIVEAIGSTAERLRILEAALRCVRL